MTVEAFTDLSIHKPVPAYVVPSSEKRLKIGSYSLAELWSWADICSWLSPQLFQLDLAVRVDITVPSHALIGQVDLVSPYSLDAASHGLTAKHSPAFRFESSVAQVKGEDLT